MELKELCELIGLPEELRKRVYTCVRGNYEVFSRRFCDPADYDNAYNNWVEQGTQDEDGSLILALMLDGACMAFEEYCKRGIPQSVFVETMKCFTRFCLEYYETYHRYGFDRGFWTGHQLSLRLFRVGTLEYELCDGDKKEISVHIPSDADLTQSAVLRSLAQSREFLKTYYPDYCGAEYHCTSWLLSPSLKSLLPQTSNIRAFAEMFELKDVDLNDESYKQWLFRDANVPIENAREDTSLQRAVKAFVLSGGKIGEGHGILKTRSN